MLVSNRRISVPICSCTDRNSALSDTFRRLAHRVAAFEAGLPDRVWLGAAAAAKHHPPVDADPLEHVASVQPQIIDILRVAGLGIITVLREEAERGGASDRRQQGQG